MTGHKYQQDCQPVLSPVDRLDWAAKRIGWRADGYEFTGQPMPYTATELRLDAKVVRAAADIVRAAVVWRHGEEPIAADLLRAVDDFEAVLAGT